MEMNDESESDEFGDVDVWECIRSIMYPYEDMEVLSTRWEQILSEMTETFHDNMDNEQYQETKEEFMTAMLEREYEYRNFITYLVFRYFAKAVYDYDVVGESFLFDDVFETDNLCKLLWIDSTAL